MLRWLITALGSVTIAYIALCASVFLLQRTLIYFPQPGSGTGGTATIALPNTTERVLVSTRPLNGPRALLYFGGNAEAVSLSLPELSNAFPDSALYLLHYRGYGGSSGKPSEAALFADALTLFDEVHAKHEDVEAVGRSLGSGVAVYLASVRPVQRLVLVTPFDSLEELAAREFQYLPVKWMLLDKYESWRYAPRVTAPVVIIAAEHDEIVPRASTELLQSRFTSGRVSLRVIPGTGHNSISDSPDYLRLLRE
jgi:pimeloyl-ACP methyl ester carboxylesterase